MLKYLIFDLDDTLVPSTQGYAVALEAIGLSVSSPEYQMARQAVKQRLPQGSPTAHSRCHYLKEMLDQQGKFSASEVLRRLSQYEQVLCEFLALEWQRLGRPRLLGQLKGRYQLAILTNESLRTQLLKLRAIDPEGEFFSLLVASEEVGFEKPDARMLAHLNEKLKHPPPDSVLFIGDNIEADLDPAQKLGWQTLWNTEFLSSPPVNSKHRQIAQLDLLMDFLQ